MRQGLRTKVVMVSDGVGSHPNSKAYPPERLRFLREEEAKQAGAELGLKPEDMRSFWASRIASFPLWAKRQNERLAPLLIARGKSALNRSLSARDTILIATTSVPFFP